MHNTKRKRDEPSSQAKKPKIPAHNNRRLENVLPEAVRANDISLVRKLAIKSNPILNNAPKLLKALLVFAIEKGFNEIVQLLYNHSIYKPTDRYLLLAGIIWNNLSIVEYFLAKRIPPNSISIIQDDTIYTPVEFALKNQFIELAHLLMQYNAYYQPVKSFSNLPEKGQNPDTKECIINETATSDLIPVCPERMETCIDQEQSTKKGLDSLADYWHFLPDEIQTYILNFALDSQANCMSLLTVSKHTRKVIKELIEEKAQKAPLLLGEEQYALWKSALGINNFLLATHLYNHKTFPHSNVVDQLTKQLNSATKDSVEQFKRHFFGSVFAAQSDDYNSHTMLQQCLATPSHNQTTLEKVDFLLLQCKFSK